MTNTYDFKLDEDGDLYIDPVTKDFVIEESTNQHVKFILQSTQGMFKEFPKVGWNPYSRLNSTVEKQKHIQDAIIQLQADGFKVNDIDFGLSAEGQLVITKLDVYRQ